MPFPTPNAQVPSTLNENRGNTPSSPKMEMMPCTITMGSIKTQDGIQDVIRSFCTEHGGQMWLFVITTEEIFFDKISPSSIPRCYWLGLREIRIFNSMTELYLWRSKDRVSYEYRVRNDGSSAGTPSTYRILDLDYMMIGEQYDPGTGLISGEPRFGAYRIAPGLPITAEDFPLKYRMRNYYEQQSTGFFSYVDARFCQIITNKGVAL